MLTRNNLLEQILSAIGGGGSVLWGAISGDINNQSDLAAVAKSNDYNDLISKFNSTTDISIERLLDAESVAATQYPTGTGFANAKKIEFGAASSAASYSLAVDGTLTINETGLYRIKTSLQFGRAGAAGTSILFFRVRVNGTQAGRSISVKLSNSNDEYYFENDTWVYLPSGTVLEFDVMRDNSGNNSGGLLMINPSDEGVGTWNDAPTAALRVERLINV